MLSMIDASGGNTYIISLLYIIYKVSFCLHNEALLFCTLLVFPLQFSAFRFHLSVFIIPLLLKTALFFIKMKNFSFFRKKRQESFVCN